MARYTAISPDGRKLTVEGPSAPTEEEWDELFKANPSAPLKLEDRYGADNIARARADVADVRQKQEDDHGLGYAVGEFFNENPVGRGTAAVLQGINKGNPLVQAASLIPGLESINDNLIEPENGFERALDLGAEFATPAGVAAKGIGALGKGAGKLIGKVAPKTGSKIAKLLKPLPMPLEYAGAGAAGAAVGAIEPDTFAGQLATGIAGGMTGAGLAGALNRGVLGVGKNYIGKSVLKDELRNAGFTDKEKNYSALRKALAGHEVGDVDFGHLTKSQLEKLNELRDLNGLIKVENGKMSIPADRVQHIYDVRSPDKNYSESKLAKTLSDALHGKSTIISRQAAPHENTIAFINRLAEPKDVAYVGARNNQNIVVSGQKMRGSNITPRKYIDLDGRPSVPSELTDQSRIQGPIGQVNNIIPPSKREVKRAMNLLQKNMGREKLAAALAGDKPLLEQGGAIINDLARAARDKSPQAAERLTEAINTRNLETPTAVRRKIDELFGTKNTIKNAEDLAARLDPKATAQYTSAFERTWIDPLSGKTKTALNRLPDSEFNKIMKNPYIARAVEEAPNVHLEVKGAAPNTLKRLDFAKETIDARINRELASEAPNTRLIASLTNAKNDLVGALENFSPAYKAGKEYSAEKLSGIAAQKAAARWSNSDVSAAKFKQEVESMTPGQLESFRIGLRDEIKQKFEHGNPEVFAKNLLNTDSKEKLAIALGKEKADALIDFARGLRAQMDTRNRVLGGSMTSTNLSGAEDALGTAEQIAGSGIKGPVRWLTRQFDTNRARNTYSALADILQADPRTLQLPTKREALLKRLSGALGRSMPQSRVAPALSVILGREDREP